MEGLKYCGTVQLERNDTGEFDNIAIYIDSENRVYPVYPDGQEIDLGQLQRDYKDLSPIKDIINKTKEMEEKEEEKEPEDRTNSIDELEQDDKQKENEEEEEEQEKDILEEEKVEELKISNTKGKIDLDQMVNGQTLRSIMGLESEYTHIAPVSSSSLGLEGTNAEYTFVALKNDNTAKILHGDIIKEDRQEGINTADQDKFVGNDGQIEKKSAVSNYIVNGKYALAVYREEGTSNLATTITVRSGRENTEGEVDTELHRDGDSRINSDSRNELRSKNGVAKSDAENEKFKEHEKEGCNPEIRDIDGDKNNDTHFHITNEQLEELVESTGENEEVLIERFKREKAKNPDKNVEQIIDIIEDDYETVNRENNR